MSKYGLEFIDTLRKEATEEERRTACKTTNPNPTEEDCDPTSFVNAGYLFLAGTQDGANKLRTNNKMQDDVCGVKGNELLHAKSSDEKERTLATVFPYLQNDDLLLGSYSKKSGDGYFDAFGYMQFMKNFVSSKGVEIIKGTVTNGVCETCGPGHRVKEVIVSVDNGKGENENVTYTPENVVIVAGSRSGDVLKNLTESSCSKPIAQLPVVGKRRVIHSFTCLDPVLSVGDYNDNSTCSFTHPLTVDPCGMWYRSEGRPNLKSQPMKFLAGMSPTEDNDPDYYPDTEHKHLSLGPCTLQADSDHFNDEIWPLLYERVNAFGGLKHTGSWCGLYDYNVKDQNAVIGYHPEISNLIMCTGFSGHGLQTSGAAGRAGAELFCNKGREGTGDMGMFDTIDLRRFNFERLYAEDGLIFEEGIV